MYLTSSAVMSDETKDTNATSDANAEAEKDVQSVLAELKAEEAKDAEKDTPAPNNSHSEETNDRASVEQALEEGQGIKEAAEITVKSEDNEECKTDSRTPRQPTTQAQKRNQCPTQMTMLLWNKPQRRVGV